MNWACQPILGPAEMPQRGWTETVATSDSIRLHGGDSEAHPGCHPSRAETLGVGRDN